MGNHSRAARNSRRSRTLVRRGNIAGALTVVAIGVTVVGVLQGNIVLVLTALALLVIAFILACAVERMETRAAEEREARHRLEDWR